MGLGTLYCKAQSTAHLGLNELCPCLNKMTLWATTFVGEVGRRCEVGLHPPLTQFFGYNPFLSLQNAAMSLATEALGEVGRLSI
jgi:hypothetical protein